MGLTAALKLHHRLLGHNTPIVVRMKASGISALLEHWHTGDDSPESLRHFGLLEQTCDSELLEHGMYESMARAKHNDYVRQQEKAGQTPETNSSMVPWDQLPATLKESNREQAAHDRVKLRSLNYDIIPRTNWESDQFEFTAEEVDDLAQLEHERWMAEKSALGTNTITE